MKGAELLRAAETLTAKLREAYRAELEPNYSSIFLEQRALPGGGPARSLLGELVGIVRWHSEAGQEAVVWLGDAWMRPALLAALEGGNLKEAEEAICRTALGSLWAPDKDDYAPTDVIFYLTPFTSDTLKDTTMADKRAEILQLVEMLQQLDCTLFEYRTSQTVDQFAGSTCSDASRAYVSKIANGFARIELQMLEQLRHIL